MRRLPQSTASRNRGTKSRSSVRLRRAAADVIRAESLETRVLFAVNLLDPTFGGGDGLATTAVGPGNAIPAAVSVLPSGKILVAGSARGPVNDDFALVRYNANGSLDQFFGGGDGIVTLPVGNADDVPVAMTVLSSGKILVAGTAIGGATTGADFALARFNADGSIDKSFGGGDGKVLKPVGPGNASDAAASMAVRSDGRILVVGTSQGGSAVSIARFTAGGAPDVSFGGDGVVAAPAVGASGTPAVAVGSGGTFYVSGADDAHAILARFRPDGTLDPSFGTGGVVKQVEVHGECQTSVLRLSDGDVLLTAGYPQWDGILLKLARLNPNGTPDAAFRPNNNPGEELFASPPFAVAEAVGGKIIVAGVSLNVLRLNPDGALDPTFDGQDGIVDVTQIDPYTVAVQPDGRIVVAGIWTGSPPGEPVQFAAARLKASDARSDPDDQMYEAKPIVIGGAAASGQVNVGDDVDLYRFTATPGQRVAIDVDRPAGGGLDPLLRLFDANGSELASNDDAPAPGEPSSTIDAYLNSYLQAGGTYYLGVSASPNLAYNPSTGIGDTPGAPTGAYTLKLMAVNDPDDQISEARPLAVGGRHIDAIVNDTDVDVYQLSLAAGQRVAVRIEHPAEATLDGLVRVFAADGSPYPDEPSSATGFTANNSRDNVVEIKAIAAGKYYVAVSALPNGNYNPVNGSGDAPGYGNASDTGGYIISLSSASNDPDDDMQEALPLAPGTIVNGSISDAKDVDLYRVTSPGGKAYTFSLTGPGDEPSAILRAFDAQGRPLADFTSGFAPAASVFYLGVSGRYNESYSAVTGGNDDLGYKGPYRLVVTSSAVPADLDDQIAEAAARPMNGKVSASLTDRFDVDMYALNAAAGDVVSIGIQAEGETPLLRLFDATGKLLAPTNEYEPVASFVSPVAATYYLGVSMPANYGYDPLTGSNDRGSEPMGAYQLTFRKFVDRDDQIAEAKPLAVGAATGGDLTEITDVAMYAVMLKRNDVFSVWVTPDTWNIDLTVRLFDASGKELSRDNSAYDYDSGDIYPAVAGTTATVTGTYFIGVSTAGNAGYSPISGRGDTVGQGVVGPFTIESSVSVVKPDPDDQFSESVPLSYATARSGVIADPTDVDMYAFVAETGRPVSILLTRSAQDGLYLGLVRVFDPAGREIYPAQYEHRPDGTYNDGETYMEFIPAATGTYHVGISARDNSQYDPVTGTGDLGFGWGGGYSLKLTRLSTDPDDQISEAIAIPIGGSATGTISASSDVDLYKVTVAAGQRLGFDLDRTSGSLLDSAIKVFNSTGGELAFNDDAPASGEAPSSDSYLRFLFARAGTYYIGVSSIEGTFYDPVTGLHDAIRQAGSGGFVLRVNGLA